MQTLTNALIDLAVGGGVGEETAAAAVPSRPDFMIALGRALEEHEAQESEEAAAGAAPDEPSAAHDDHALRVENHLRIA